jgi:hypothetical protein
VLNATGSAFLPLRGKNRAVTVIGVAFKTRHAYALAVREVRPDKRLERRHDLVMLPEVPRVPIKAFAM